MLIALRSHHSIRCSRFDWGKLFTAAAMTVLLTGSSFAAGTKSTKSTSNSTTTKAASLITEKAVSSDRFVDSMGLVIHLENTGTVYQTHLTDIIEPALAASGFRHVRDGGLASSTNSYGMNQLYAGTYTAVANYVKAQTGHRLGYVLMTAPLNLGSSTGSNCNDLTTSPVSTLVKYLSPSIIDGFEGINEFDWQYSLFAPNCATASNWPTINAAFQASLYADVKSNKATSFLPVAGPSLGTPAGMADMLSTSTSEDFGNQHSYPAGRYPSADIVEMETQLDGVNGTAKPYVATETGYYTMPDGISGVSELAASKYMTRLYFEYFNHGVAKTYTYELIDSVGGAETAAEANTWHGHFGLLRADGSKKPSFGAIANEIAILSDPGASFTPGTLSYSVGASVPTTLHHTTLQKRNGTFEVALWQEVTSYNLMKEFDIVNPTVAVPLTLGFTASKINVYDPLVGTTPVETYTDTATVTLQVPDHTLILEIIP